MRAKRLYTALALLFVAGVAASAQYVSGYSDLYDSETSSALRSHIELFTCYDFQGRKAGSEGEKASAEYIFSTLENYGVTMLTPKEGELFGIARGDGDTLQSRNVYGVVQGYDKKLSNRYIVIGARIDNLGADSITVNSEVRPRIYYGANGNASGLAMMMELAKQVSVNSFLFRRSIIFIALGASQESYAGAWYFLNRSFSEKDNIDAMINLDMLGSGSSSFQAYTGSNEDMNKILALAAEQLQPVLPEISATETYPSDHRAFYSADIPFVAFSTGRYPEHDTDRDVIDILDFGSMEREIEYIFNFTRTLCNVEVAPRLHKTEDNTREDNDIYAWYDCEIKPTFLGRADPRFFLEKWVYQYIKYPQEAVKKGIQGRVSVEFIVEKDGTISSVEVAKSAHELLDKEAVRVVSASPKWKPAKVRGKVVRASYSIPIEFRLEKNGKISFGIKK